MRRLLKVTGHNWASFLETNPYEQILISCAGVPITYILLTNWDSAPDWLVLNPVATLLCFCAAFLRVWRTAIEERETAEAWDMLDGLSTPRVQLLDNLLEPAWILSMFLLPFAAVAAQFALVIFAVFYFIDVMYNWIFFYYLSAYYDEHEYSPQECSDCPYRWYFRRRQLLSVFLMLTCALGSGAVWYVILFHEPTASVTFSIITISIILITEGLIEPAFDLRFHFAMDETVAQYAHLRPVRHRTQLTDEAAVALSQIHDDGFGPDEQQFTMDWMLEHCEDASHRLFVLERRGEVAGYAFGQVLEHHQAFVLWYMAIAAKHRSRGVGSRLVRLLVDELPTDPQPLRFMMFESRSPRDRPELQKTSQRRIMFYRRLGAAWLRGLDYRIASALPGDEPIPYEILFFTFVEDVPRNVVLETAAEMQRLGAGTRQDLVERFANSVDRSFILPPPAGGHDESDSD